jgi:ribosome-associated protein
MQTFNLEDHEFIELHNLLKITGLVGSGGMAKNLVGAGQVLVDDQVELRKRCKIRVGQVVEFAGEQIKVEA